MRRRRLLLGMGALALLAVTVLLLVSRALAPEPGITRENFGRLRKGMMLNRAEAMLGRPADIVWPGIDSPPHHWWREGDLSIELDVGADGRVADGVAFEGELPCKRVRLLAPGESLFNRLRRLLLW
jgi:hypothetical protein